jgi:FkbM family methyltransferase
VAIDCFLYDSPAFENFLKDNPHEQGEVRFLESIVEGGMNVIDIGANVGIATAAIARRIGGGNLCSFEPVPEYFDTLRRNLSFNKLENVSVYELAVTDRVGRLNFYHKGLFSGIISEKGARRFEVSSITLDRFLSDEKIERVDLINMDCEGSELFVLGGAKQTLQKNKVNIFCEVHHDFLKQLGQSVEGLVKYLQGFEFEVQSVSLNDGERGVNFDNCDYIYAHNLNKGRSHAHLRL